MASTAAGCPQAISPRCPQTETEVTQSAVTLRHVDIPTLSPHSAPGPLNSGGRFFSAAPASDGGGPTRCWREAPGDVSFLDLGRMNNLLRGHN